MSGVLEDLFYGNINPGEVGLTEGSIYAVKLKELVNCQNKLNQLLGEDEKKLFAIFCEAQSEFNEATAARNFIYGFKLGTRLIIEVVNDDRN